MSQSEDPVGDRLRVGTWLPSYDPAGRHAAPERVGQAPDGASPAVAPAPPVTPIEPTKHRFPAGSERRLVLVGAAVVALLVLVAVVAGRPDSAALVVQAGPSTNPAASDARPSTSPSAPLPPSPVANTMASAPARVPPLPAPTTPATSGAADTPLTAGTRVGLAPVTNPGYRVRHRDFIGRIDPIGAGSSPLARADSTFTVRAGLADSRCVSFESVNYPGYFLRHQNFQIHLHQYDGTTLFAADATFCPVPGLTGQHTSFRSVDYPTRYLHHRADQLYLDPLDGTDPTRAAMTFAVQPGLYG